MLCECLLYIINDEIEIGVSRLSTEWVWLMTISSHLRITVASMKPYDSGNQSDYEMRSSKIILIQFIPQSFHTSPPVTILINFIEETSHPGQNFIHSDLKL